MLHRSNLHEYQAKSVEHIKKHPQSMLWLDIGLGKTVSTLTALADLIAEGKIYGVLVLGPLRVCQTVWEEESRKWSHLQHLDFSLIHGGSDHRKRAIRRRRMFYLLNYEGLPWAKSEFIAAYMAKGRPLPFNAVVMDESTLVKSARIKQGGKRAQALQDLLAWIPYRISLTGTPAPNGLLDLFGQFLTLDGGERLGTAYTHYRDSYFKSDYNGYKYEPTEQGKQIIYQRISDITLQMSAKDYLSLPPVTINNIELSLSPKLQKKYEVLEKEMFLELDSGVTLNPTNQAGKTNKCLQYANGACYIEPGNPKWEHVHDVKLDAVGDILEELSGNPLLVGYQFKSDAQRLLKLAEKMKIEAVHVHSRIPAREMKDIRDRWNQGQLPLLIGHGASLGHGLNLQAKAHHIAWFGLPWSSEWYDQLNGRLARQGQQKKVIIHQILIRDTLDYATLDAQVNKAATQKDLKAAVNRYRQQKAA